MTWNDATATQKENFFQQLADIYINLEQHPFKQLGRLQISLCPEVPEIASAFFGYDCNGKLIPFGSFSQSNDYYTALIEERTSLIKTGEIATSAPIEQYLVYKTLLDHLPPNSSGPFFLHHIDSRDANFMVDDEYNIIGIIDWELAILGPKSAAFQSPLL